jgi:hypothetical protein
MVPLSHRKRRASQNSRHITPMAWTFVRVDGSIPAPIRSCPTRCPSAMIGAAMDLASRRAQHPLAPAAQLACHDEWLTVEVCGRCSRTRGIRRAGRGAPA